VAAVVVAAVVVAAVVVGSVSVVVGRISVVVGSVVGGAIVVAGAVVVGRCVVVGAVVVGAVVVGSVVDATVVGACVVVFPGATVGRVSDRLGSVSCVPPPSPCVAMNAATMPARSRTAAAASAIGSSGRLRRVGRMISVAAAVSKADGARIVVASPGAARSSASRARPSRGRSAGFFASAARATLSSPGGASGRSEPTVGGGSSRCMRTSSIAFFDWNGRRPASIRKRITPNE
jgi:hypothetical protein